PPAELLLLILLGLRPYRAGQRDSPDRAVLKRRPFRLQKTGGFASNHPYMSIGGLFSHDRCNDASDSSYIDFDHIVASFFRRTRNSEGFLAGRRDFEFHH